MKILLTILKVIGVLIALVLLIALFVKKELKAEKEIVINKPNAIVFDYVKLLKNQNNYSKWTTMDPAMKKEFKGADGTVGFVSAWDSDNKDVGKGEQEITKIVGNRIDYELRFLKPTKATNYAFMRTEPLTDSTTKVIWGFNGKMNYPLNIMNLFFDAEKMVGDDFAIGLDNLKRILEK